MDTGGVSPGVKWQGHEADHSPPSSAEVKNGGATPVLLNTSSWRRAYLIKSMDNFAFTCYISSMNLSKNK
jgi:hypothetical protein